MKIKKLHKKNIEESNMELLNLLRERLKLRLQEANGKLKQTHLIKKIRRNIAKLKTLLTKR